MEKIPISQFLKEMRELPINQKLKFIYDSEEATHKEQTRFLFKVETKNIITIRELDNRKVWLYQPKKDTIYKLDKNIYLLKDYLSNFDNKNDLKIEVIL